jgi:hypothetical protein
MSREVIYSRAARVCPRASRSWSSPTTRPGQSARDRGATPVRVPAAPSGIRDRIGAGRMRARRLPKSRPIFQFPKGFRGARIPRGRTRPGQPHNSARGHKSNDWYPNRDVSKRRIPAIRPFARGTTLAPIVFSNWAKGRPLPGYRRLGMPVFSSRSFGA